MNIYLIGFMGCGKSETGKGLASALGWELSDTDALLEEKFGTDIPGIFDRYGEKRFREEESKLLRALPRQGNRIVVTGGGLPCFHGNMDYMNRNGHTVYMEVPATVLAARLARPENKNQRPLLRDLGPETLDAFVEELLGSRDCFYRKAHFVFKPQEAPLAALFRHVEKVAGKNAENEAGRETPDLRHEAIEKPVNQTESQTLKTKTE